MPPLEPRDHRISLKEAAGYLTRHRSTLDRVAEGDHGGAFHADQVLEILAQKGCAALRIYHGRDEKGNRVMVLVGMDGEGNDMTSGLVCETWFPCPPWCPPDDTLLKS